MKIFLRVMRAEIAHVAFFRYWFPLIWPYLRLVKGKDAAARAWKKYTGPTPLDAAFEFWRCDSMTKDNLPTPVWSGSFKIGGVDMKCHVLDDGRRIIEEESIMAFFTNAVTPTQKELDDLARFVKGSGVPE